MGKVYAKIMEIESRLLPCGLHTVGVPPTAEEAIATLVNIASIDRNEDGIKSLPRILAKSVGKRHRGRLPREGRGRASTTCSLGKEITEGVRAAVRASVERSTDAEGRVTEVNEMMGSFGDLMAAARR